MAITYPQSLPLSEIKSVIDIVRAGQVVEKKQTFAFSLWVIQGYGQSILLGASEPDLVLISAQSAPADFDAVVELEKLVTTSESSEPTTQGLASSIAWKFLAKWATEQLLDLLAKNLGQ